MIKATVVYAISEFCAIIMFGLNASLKAVTNYGKREKWLPVFITQGRFAWRWTEHRDSWACAGRGAVDDPAKPYVDVDVVSVAVFFYIDSCGQLTMSDTKKKLAGLPAGNFSRVLRSSSHCQSNLFMSGT